MVYKIEVVERDVRIAIDENKTSDQLISDEDIDTLSLNDIIRSKIVEAVRRVESRSLLGRRSRVWRCHLLGGERKRLDSAAR